MQDLQRAVQTARFLMDLGHSVDAVLANGLIPEALRNDVRRELEKEATFVLVPARTVVLERGREDWIKNVDRSEWTYWPTLRSFLLSNKQWSLSALRSLDDSSDRILRLLAPPSTESFDIRGLVLGFVQSGKTANYTSLIAKAADSGYRLFIVLSGIDNGLRRQTNIRLKKELVGYSDARTGAIPMPAMGKQWHEFTRDELHGDFQPGFANHAALQGSQPVLLVIKKNGAVLRRLMRWLDGVPLEIRHKLPLLLIDDEADQASVDVRGSYQQDADEEDEDRYEAPSVINGLIRQLLGQFERRAYVAYTATPFANILIPHDTFDPTVGSDLYPKDFIVDLPKPPGYFGAEEFFGRLDEESGELMDGLNAVRHVPDLDLAAMDEGDLPASFRAALLDFVLAGAARSQRGDSAQPATMLVHTSPRIEDQSVLYRLVSAHFTEFRDEWRYQRRHGIVEVLQHRWETEFLPITREVYPEFGVAFHQIESQIGPFLESVQVKEINSSTGEVLDYEREPDLKAIAVGGNRLSRGLTLEGLLVSYFVRRSATYDTLMQMGRWFGYRGGYQDLTRIWTTAELAGWFSDLALVEFRLREDIQVYEAQGLTPYELGMRISKHPTMQITSPLKRRFATETTISQTYSLALEQTFKFPLQTPSELFSQAEENQKQLRAWLQTLDDKNTDLSTSKGPVWTGVSPEKILEYLRTYQTSERVRTISIPLIAAYIERMRDAGELVSWTVAVRGRETRDTRLGVLDLGPAGGEVNLVSRSKLRSNPESLGVIVDPEDESIGIEDGNVRGKEARRLRDATEGLLLIYPISRASGYDASASGNREALLRKPSAKEARDLIGIAFSFPQSSQPQDMRVYLEGTAGWRPI